MIGAIDAGGDAKLAMLRGVGCSGLAYSLDPIGSSARCWGAQASGHGVRAYRRMGGCAVLFVWRPLGDMTDGRRRLSVFSQRNTPTLLLAYLEHDRGMAPPRAIRSCQLECQRKGA